MITEEQWAKFAKHVKVGDRVQYRNDDMILNGTLLENYPHAEKARNKEDAAWVVDLLEVKFENGETGPILAQYEYFWMEDDQTWYRFDDILMFEDESEDAS